MAESYTIVNTVRAIGTRTHRALSKTRHRFKQFIAGQRLIRNGKLVISAEKFEAERDKIHKLVLAGIVSVITPENVRVTSTPDGRYILTKMATGATKVLEVGETPSCFSGTTVVSKPKPEVVSRVEVKPEPQAQAPEELEETEDPDDLTALPSVGSGRARKLVAAGLTDFQKVSDAGSKKVMEILGVVQDMADEIVAAATEMKE